MPRYPRSGDISYSFGPGALSPAIKILIITNDDGDALAGGVTIAPGQTRMYIFIGGAWRLIS